MEDYFSPLRLPINEVFNAIKDQSWVKRPEPIQYNPMLPGAEEYYSYHDSKGHQTVHCRSLQKYLEKLVRQSFFKECVLTSWQHPMQDTRALRFLPNHNT